MKRLSEHWYRFWKNRRIIFSILVICAVSLFGYLVQNLRIYEDITKTLPQSEQFEKLKKIVEHGGLNSSIYLSLRDTEGWEAEKLKSSAELFCEELIEKSDGKIANLSFDVGEDEKDLYDLIDARVPYYLDQADYSGISERLDADSISQRLNRNHEKLFTPEGFVLKDFLLNDPLGVTARALLKFKSLEKESAFEVQDELFMIPSDSSLFLVGEVMQSKEDRHELAECLREIQAKWKKDGFEVEFFSPFLIAEANASQIKKDTTLTLTISLGAIILLLLIYYRSIVLPLFFILPAVIGLIFSVAMLAIFKAEVSAISLGAGAVVLGIMMDYSFHFFTHLKHSGSISETIKEVTDPLLTGCLTTILAFLALTFTSSPVLQDFGLFAAFSLIGAAFSVLFVLPVFLPKLLVNKWHARPEKKFSLKIGKPIKLAVAIAVIGFTVVAIIYAPGIGFDDELMNLNHYPEELKDAEKKFRNVDPDKEKNIFVVSQDASHNLAREANYNSAKRLKELQTEGKINSIITTAVFDVPVSVGNEKVDNWNHFWAKNGERVGTLLDSMEAELDYYENAFDNFKSKINGDYEIPETADNLPSLTTDLDKLADSTAEGWTYITIFSVPLVHRDSVLEVLREDLTESEVFDRSEMAGTLVTMVRDDFNFILLASSLLVFLTLLIIYGRIELAVITFLPMVMSWIWIIGIAAIIGIEFNFVNIVISTFIFGLGDDFAIFITDGYVGKFSRNKDSLVSYKRGILLSAATTIIGTGALIFAVHPALNSVALISVIGMVAILIISFTVQPWLLRRMLTNRKNKGLPPVSLMNLFFGTLTWVFFLPGCLVLFPIQLIFRIIPFGQKRLKLTYHHIMRVLAWMQMYFMINLRKKVVNRQNFDFSKPSMIIANHQSQIDVVMMMTFHPKVVIMTNDWVHNSPVFGPQIRYLGFFPGSDGIEKNLEVVRPWVADGYSVIIFPEGTRSKNKKIGRFHKGAFYIAEQLKLDVIPVMLHGLNDAMRKGDFLLQNAKTSVNVLPRIPYSDESWGTTFKERGKNISRYFKEEFRKYDLQTSDSYYLQHKILSAYVFRSPFIEWYVKVKWLFEKKNFDHYHSLIPESGRIYDLGCGYGYLSYYLHYRSEERELIGVDYDADKIEIAENCYLVNENTKFLAGDIREIEFQNADAIFLNDVIHYLPGEDHEPMLERCLNGLSENGIILIRDGVTDLDERHKKTELTEKYSTKIIGFNKSENHLCFFSRKFIEDFAEKHGLSCEIAEQSRKTSNILFVLKRR